MSRWPCVQLRRIARMSYGDSLAADSRRDGGIPVYGSNGPVGLHDEANTAEPVIVVGRKGSYGKLQYVDTSVFAIDTTFFIDHTSTDADLRWLHYALSTIGLDTLSQDVGVPGLSREDAYKQRIPFPPSSEQRRIAEYLDAETERIDALITAKTQMIELLEERWTAELVSLFQGDWPVVALRRLFRVINGGTPRADEENWGGDVQWATPVDLAKCDRKHISETERTLTTTGLQAGSKAVGKGSLIVSTRAPVGYVTETTRPMAFNQGCKGLEPVVDLDIRFFRYQLSAMTETLQSMGQGSTFVELSGDDLAAVPVAVPPIGKQTEIADRVDSEAQRVTELTGALSVQIELLRERRRSLITAVVTGELEVA